MPPEVQKYVDQLEGRAMLVKKAEVVPIEAIVRGYITGMSPSFLLRLVLISSVAHPSRFRVGGIQEDPNSSWNSYARRPC